MSCKLICGVALSICSLSSAHAAITFSDTENISHYYTGENYTDFQPDIACSNDGSDKMVVYRQDETIVAQFSTDSGASYNDPVIISSSNYYNGYPRVATNNHGIWTVVWQYQEDINYRVFDQSTGVWGAVIEVNTDSYIQGWLYDHVESDPKIACSEDGYWILTFTRECVIEGDNFGLDRDIFFCSVQTANVTDVPIFGTPHPLLEAQDGIDCDEEVYAEIDVSPTGEFRMIWNQFSPIFPYIDNPCDTDQDSLRYITAVKPDSNSAVDFDPVLSGDGFEIQNNLLSPGLNPMDLTIRYTSCGWLAAWSQVDLTSPNGERDIYAYNFFSAVQKVNNFGDTDTVDDSRPCIGSSDDRAFIAWQSNYYFPSQASHGQNIMCRFYKGSQFSSNASFVDRNPTIDSNSNRYPRATSVEGTEYISIVWQSSDTHKTGSDWDIVGATYGM